MGTRKKSRKNRSRRAVSPVIATVILVAIAITVSVAVAYWMGGIAGQYTRFEQIEIQSAVCYKDISDPANYFWNISLSVKNAGTRDTTLISAFINEVEVDRYDVTTFLPASDDDWATSMSTTTYITVGNSTGVFFYIDPDKAGATLTSGTMVNIKIYSSGGMDYSKLIKLT
jgi:flagellin-like protein